MEVPTLCGGPSRGPSLALHDYIVAGSILLRPAVAKTRDRAIDHRWASSPHGLVAETKPFHGTGPKVLDQHIRSLHKSPENFLAALAFHIECNALLIAIDGEEIGGLVALKWRLTLLRGFVVGYAGKGHVIAGHKLRRIFQIPVCSAILARR
jgi:hypothetical protein